MHVLAEPRTVSSRMPVKKAAASKQLITLQFYFARVLESDGNNLTHWEFARELLRVSDATLQQHYREHRDKLSEQQLTEVIVGIKVIEQLRETLRRLDDEHLQHLNLFSDWFRIKAKLRLVMPLVEQLLGATS